MHLSKTRKMLLNAFCIYWSVTAVTHASYSTRNIKREKKYYLPGTSVTFCCKNTTETWSSKDSWHFNRTLVTSAPSSGAKSSEAYVLANGCLHIKSIAFDFHPRYRCKTNQIKWVFHLIPREEKFINSPYMVDSPVVQIGDNITIKGCQLSSVDGWNTNMFYWMKDGFRVISTSVSISDNLTRFGDLVLNWANQSHQGYYQCVMNVTNKNGDYVEIKSEKVNVQFSDISHTRFNINMKRVSNISKSQFQKILISRTKDAILNLTKSRDPIVQVTRLRFLSDNVADAKVHVMYKLVTSEQRISYCEILKNLSVYSDAAFVVTSSTATSLDCCDKEHLETQGKGRYLYNISLAAPIDRVPKTCRYSKHGEENTIYRQCKPDLEFGPRWTEANSSNCLLTLESLKQAVICYGKKIENNCTTIEDVTENLGMIVKTGSDINKPSDLIDIANLVVRITNAISESSDINLKAINRMVGVASSLLDARLEFVSRAQINENSSRKIVKSMESLSEFIGRNLEDESTVQINQTNMGVTVVNTNTKNLLFLVYKNRKTNEIEILLKRPSNSPQLEGLVASIEIPSEAFGNKGASLYSVFYKRNSFFLSEQELYYNIGNRSVTVDRPSLSGVLATSFVGEIVRNLSTSITINFSKSYLKRKEGVESCAFWDFATGRYGGSWSHEGCIQVVNENPGFVTCKCNHLTNFAVLLHVTQSEFHHQFELTLITWFGCGMSIMGLTLTITTILLFKKVRKRLSQRILVHLCFSLLFLLLIFLTGIKRTSYRVCCQVISVLIHYFMLASFFWTTVEGINIYKYFVTVFRTGNNDSFLKKSCLFAWGCPAVIVVLNALIATDDLGNSDICIVRGKSFYYAVLIPVILSLVGNFLILVLVLYSISKRTAAETRNRKSISVLREIRIAFSFAILLGLTWLFGILAVGKATQVFQWLFCLLSSLQGFFIFLLYTVKNEEARTEWQKLFRNIHALSFARPSKDDLRT